MLERNPPLPTRFVGNGSRIGYGRADTLGLHRHCSVTREPMSPIVVPCGKRLFNQQAPETGAVDEEVPLNHRAVTELELGDIPVEGVLADIGDFAFATDHTIFFRNPAQELCIQ